MTDQEKTERDFEEWWKSSDERATFMYQNDIDESDADFKYFFGIAAMAFKYARSLSERADMGIPISAQGKCWCTSCRPITMDDMRFVVCPSCGNKRCPKAHNHELACTNSNAPGQAGSSWEHVKPLG